MTAFDDQPALSGDTIDLRPLISADLEPLFAAASDPAIWAGHPAKTRHEREFFEPYFKFLLTSGGTLVAIDRAKGRIIGCSRYYTAPDRPGTISVGFTFLERAYWGGTANFEMKQLMFDHAFQHFGEVWLHIAPTNIRSQKATQKLGAVHEYDAILDISGTAAPTQCYRLSRAAWADTVARRTPC